MGNSEIIDASLLIEDSNSDISGPSSVLEICDDNHSLLTEEKSVQVCVIGICDNYSNFADWGFEYTCLRSDLCCGEL